MRGVLVAIAATNLFVMVPTGRIMLPHQWGLLSKKIRKPICVPVKKQAIHRIVMARTMDSYSCS